MVEIKTLDDMYQLALTGNQNALEELSGVAFGGNLEARKMIKQIEDKNIVFKDENTTPKISKRSDLPQIIFHPIDSIQTKLRQIEVSIDMAQAPIGSNQEDFPNLRIAEASSFLRQNRKNK